MIQSPENCNYCISFIVPIFNGQDTVLKCIDSIYRLGLASDLFEVIVVDDCSTDNTVSIIQEYSLLHSNLTLLRQEENHRQGAARNRGVSIAKGDFIVFVDSDDQSYSGVVSAIKFANEKSLEMVAIKALKYSQDNNVVFQYELPYGPEVVFSGIELQAEHKYWCTAPWAYIYRRAFLDAVKYPFAEDVLFEDADFVFVHLFHARRMGYCDEPAYLMYENPKSTTHTISYKHVADYALLGNRMLKFYEQIKDMDFSFSDSVLEGGSYNIMRSFRNIFKLSSVSDIRSFYERIDSFIDRRNLLVYRKPSYYWTKWTRFAIKHRHLATYIVELSLPLLKIIRSKQ